MGMEVEGRIATREEMKAEAVERMKKLHLLDTPIKEFEKDDKLNLSEHAGMLYWLNDEQQKIVSDWENEYGHLVYHVIHSFTNIGELYNLLYVSKYKDDWKDDRACLDEFMTIAHVVNMDMPDCSESGSIGIKPSFGGLIRTW